jgi:hypothetical protein
MDDEAEQFMIEVVRKHKPQTIQQLKKIVSEKVLLSSDEVSQLLLKLEDEGKFYFAKKEGLD